MSSNSSPTHMRILIQEENLEEGAIKVLESIRPKWIKDNVNFKLFTDGYTNKLMGCYNLDHPEDVILIRIYGQNTDLLIDRKAETRNIRLLHEYGFAPRLYATFSNGLAYEYMPGDILTVDTCKSPEVFPLIARMMANIHRVECGPNVPKTPCLWEKLQLFLDLAPKAYDDADKQARFVKLIPSLCELESEVSLLKTRLGATSSPIVFCHNDLLLANIIYDKTKSCVKFIDFEYASYNYQAYDIGNHFAEFAGMAEVDFSRFPSKEFQFKWLKAYLESYHNDIEEVTEHEIQRLYVQVNQFSLVTHLFWGIWALVQAQHSEIDFDFLRFSSLRIDEYFLKKDEFLELKANL